MNVGDRVRKEKVMGKTDVCGTIIKITSEYVVVSWDDVNGHWHYTPAQTGSIEVVSGSG